MNEQTDGSGISKIAWAIPSEFLQWEGSRGGGPSRQGTDEQVGMERRRRSKKEKKEKKKGKKKKEASGEASKRSERNRVRR